MWLHSKKFSQQSSRFRYMNITVWLLYIVKISWFIYICIWYCCCTWFLLGSNTSMRTLSACTHNFLHSKSEATKKNLKFLYMLWRYLYQVFKIFLKKSKKLDILTLVSSKLSIPEYQKGFVYWYVSKCYFRRNIWRDMWEGNI